VDRLATAPSRIGIPLSVNLISDQYMFFLEEVRPR
jgi:hypothetical protein